MNRTINPIVYHAGEANVQEMLLSMDELKTMDYYESTFNMPSYMSMVFERTLYGGYNAEMVMPVVFGAYGKPWFGMAGALEMLGFKEAFKDMVSQHYDGLKAKLCICADHKLPELLKLTIMLDEEGVEALKTLLGLGATPEFDTVVKTVKEWGAARYV